MQWLLNGIPIPGETLYQVTTSTNGVYTLEITNSFGCVFTSWPVSIDVGIHEQDALAPLLFPNPANESVTVRWGNGGEASVVELQDLSGRIIKQLRSSLGSEEINTSDLPNGVYLVSVWSGGLRGVARLAVSR